MERAGRFRALSDGQIDFTAVFSKAAQYDLRGWAVVEWECAPKHPEDGAREGVRFVHQHIIRTTDHAFDDFAGSPEDAGINRGLLGLDRTPWEGVHVAVGKPQAYYEQARPAGRSRRRRARMPGS